LRLSDWIRQVLQNGWCYHLHSFMRSIFLGSFLAIATLVPSLTAQSKTGTVVGRVQDPSKKVGIPGAKVTLTNAETNETYKSWSNDTGRKTAGGEFKFQVPPGTYTVTVELPGFERVGPLSVTVKENKSRKLDPITLRVAPPQTPPLIVVPPSSNQR
jgi:Carboxypeptidase regulatory-like domain